MLIPVTSAWSSALRGISVGWKVMGMMVAAASVPACWVRPPMPAFGDLMPIPLLLRGHRPEAGIRDENQTASG